MDTTKAITHLSLCSGYSGIGLGLKRVLPNLREIAHVEIEAFAVANLVAKMESKQMDAAPIYTDVKTFPYRQFSGCVDILSGGFPCQPFSAAGTRQGVEDHRHLYPYISKGIEECRPRIVFLENVEGIISSKTADGESVLKYVLSDLERMGYRSTAGIFSASEVGAPHQRKRIFIMGYSKYNGHTSCSQSRGISQSEEERRMQESKRGSNELSNSENIRCGGRDSTSKDKRDWSVLQREQKGREVVSQTKGCSRDMADSNNSRGREDRQSTELRTSGSEQSSYISGQANQDQEHQGWKSMGNTDVEGLQRQFERQSRKGYNITTTDAFPSRPNKLGRAANGSSSRVDRLRLLGNGVVPQTATKAFVTLLQRCIDC